VNYLLKFSPETPGECDVQPTVMLVFGFGFGLGLGYGLTLGLGLSIKLGLHFGLEPCGRRAKH